MNRSLEGTDMGKATQGLGLATMATGDMDNDTRGWIMCIVSGIGT